MMPMVLLFGEEWIGALAIFFLFGTPMVLGGLSMIKGMIQTEKRKGVQRLEALCQAQAEELRALRQRLENLEAIVTSSDYQAGQRIARAIEERGPTTPVSPRIAERS